MITGFRTKSFFGGKDLNFKLRSNFMNWQEWNDTAVKKAREGIILTVFSLIGFLLVAIFQAVPSSVWSRVSESTPKPVLWALLGLQTITIAGLVLYIFHLKRSAPRNLPETSLRLDLPDYIGMFGVLWDKHINASCPICKVLMSPTEARIGVFKCPKCHRSFALKDELGKNVNPVNAKREVVERHVELVRQASLAQRGAVADK
jgi:hypothetical protein